MAVIQVNRPVVVGVDGTDFSLKALDWAATYAADHDCPLRIVHVQTGREASATTVKSKVDNRLTFRDGPRPRTTTWRVRFGSRSDILTDEAAGATLLVLGHREPQPLLGSTLRGVFAAGTGKVVVVPGGWSSGAKPTGRIVVGVKDADDRRVLEVAFATAAERGSRVQAISVIGPPTAQQGRTWLDETRRQEAKALSELNDALTGPRLDHPEVAVEPLVIQGDPAAVLCRAAGDADLLAIGGRSVRGLPTMIISTTESIMKQASRPVMVVGPSVRQHRQLPDLAGSPSASVTARPAPRP